MPLPDWARAHGLPLFAAAIRTRPSDFIVHEVLSLEFANEGEHDYLHLEKTGANTEWVARQVARHAGVSAREVGYSGLKDRHAITRQWFSVPRWNAPDWDGFDVEGVTLLEQHRHSRKLRRGAHRENRFRIVLRGEPGVSEELEERLRRIATTGVPNYFGEQRFGREGSNIGMADQWASGERLPRHKRSIAISTARSYLFNRLLSDRVRDGTWNQVIAGDTVNLDGTGSVFEVDEVDDDIRRRCDEQDLHPAGVLWGEGAVQEFAEFEHWQTALARARVQAAHRSLRLRIMDLEWSLQDDALTLGFGLSRGAFATSVLREIADYATARRG